MEQNFTLDDVKNLVFGLFNKADKNKCNLTIEFLTKNSDLLKKTIGKDTAYYGITEGSTALHLLAKKDFQTALTTAYSTQSFFRNIYADINTVIDCLHQSIGDAKFITKLRELDILNKKDKNGKTIMNIIDENMRTANDAANREKYTKLKEIIQAIQGNGEAILDQVIEPTVDVLKIEIDINSIIEETTKDNKKIIRIRNNKENKPYRVVIVKKRTLKSPLKKLKTARRLSVKRMSVKALPRSSSAKTV
jgi:hypothetical protein